MGVMVPGILRDVGDIPHLAALASPRRLVISGAVESDGTPIAKDQLPQRFQWTKQVYKVDKAVGEFKVLEPSIAAAVAALVS
jgi:hypothetical protein